MSTAISRLHAADFEEALDVLNLAFGKAPPRDLSAASLLSGGCHCG